MPISLTKNRRSGIIHNRSGYFLFFLYVLSCIIVVPVNASDNDWSPYTTSVTSSHTWNESFLGLNYATMNVSVNTSIWEGEATVRGSNRSVPDEIRQEIVLEPKAVILQINNNQSSVPRNRILRSALSLSDYPDNLVLFVSDTDYFLHIIPSENKLKNGGNAGYGISDTSYPAYPKPADIVQLVLLLPKAPSIFAPSHLLEQLILLWTHTAQEMEAPAKYSLKCDHRTGFWGDATSTALIQLEMSSAEYLSADESRRAAIPSVNFTFRYTVEYCESDLILGYCPGSKTLATQTILFERKNLYLDFDERDSASFSFKPVSTQFVTRNTFL